MENWKNYKFYGVGKEVSKSGNYKTKIREIQGVENRRQKNLKDSEKQQKIRRSRTVSNVGDESEIIKQKERKNQDV